jgi:hypothetical protein
VTIENTTVLSRFTGNGVTTAFATGFAFFDAADVQVYFGDVLQTAGYTITGGNGSTGTVTFSVAPAALTAIIFRRAVPYIQTTDYTEITDFPAESHEDALDRAAMRDQQLLETLGRTPQLPLTVNGVNLTLPVPLANATIAWNSQGTGFQNLDVTQLASIAAFGTARTDVYTADGVWTQRTLTANPGSINNILVFVDNVAQEPNVDFFWNGGTTLTFASAPTAGLTVWVRYMQGLPTGITNASDVQYLAAGTSAGSRPVQDKLREFVSVKDFLAVGDGTANDATPIANAITAAQVLGATLVFPAGTYRINNSVTFPVDLHVVINSAVLKPASGAVITINGGFSAPVRRVFDLSLGGTLAGAPQIETIYPEWWGAKGDGTESATTTAALQSAASFAVATGRRYKISLTGNKYTLSDTVVITSAGDFPLIEGRGRGQTIIENKFGTAKAALRFVGGVAWDGNEAVVRGVKFDGTSGTTWGIEFQGCTAAWAEECSFINQLDCIVFYNKTSGQFTEFCGARRCHFDCASGRVLRYRRDSGTESFHGCGMDGGIINENSANTYSLIEVDSGCRPYNSPLRVDGLFKQSAQSFIRMTTSSAGFVYFHGYICAETFANVSWEIASTANLTFLGPLMDIGAEATGNPERGMRLGSLQQATRIDHNGVGGANAMLLPRPLLLRITTNPSLLNLNIGNGNYVSVVLRVTATGYEYVYQIDLYQIPGTNNANLVVGRPIVSNNTSGWGAPTITWDSTNFRLSVANANYPTTGTVIIAAQVNYLMPGSLGFFQ